MRIALVSPYSWTYPGGVTRHIEALAQQYLAAGHDVRVLGPYDPTGLLSTVMHRGAAPQDLPEPEHLRSLGRTVGFNANGAVSNLSIGPAGVFRLARELATGGYDVAHIHEPVAPMVGWVATLPFGVPLVGTFHSYSTKWLPNQIANGFGATQVLNRLRVRIAVSEAAKWTGERWFGGNYRVIPNGVALDQDALDRSLAAQRDEDPLQILFVGQAVERKGLPLLLRAFEALREYVPAELTVIGPSQEELAPLLIDPRGVHALGKVDDARKHAELLAADVLAAPSLGGESFGMVLTEAFAAGTAVVASDIAGYRDVVHDGVDGLLVPPGDAQTLAEALRELYHEPARRHAMARAAADTVKRFAWEHVAMEVMDAYKDAIAMPEPQGTVQTLGVHTGFVPADLKPRVKAARIPSLERPAVLARTHKQRVIANLRRTGAGLITLAVIWLAYLALKKIGIASIGKTLIDSEPSYVILGLVTMCAAMVMRGFSWHAILEAALPKTRIRMGDVIRGTMIGVLMSSTLPARLGEPSRALIIARRTGRPRETLPVVLGTLVCQTVLNIVALIILGAIMFSSVDLFSGHENVLLVAAIAPAALLAFVIVAPIVLRFGLSAGRFQRAGSAVHRAQLALGRVRAGLVVFTDLKLGTIASATQLTAWGLQSLSCYFLLMALGLDHQTGFGAAAAVLFAVNITAVLPATPANLGVFQAACATVLHTGWHVSYGTGVAYGVILQAVEVVTAILLGMPALLREGMTWREVRLRAMNAAPVKLPPRGADAPSTSAATD